MLELTTSLRNKAVISLFASTGCRVGAIPDLKLRDVSEMLDGCRCVIFYRGEPEEYIGFPTPEASRALDLYLQKRRSDRESLTQDSPLFRESYRVGSGKAMGMTLKAVHNMMCDLVIKVLGKSSRVFNNVGGGKKAVNY